MVACIQTCGLEKLPKTYFFLETIEYVTIWRYVILMKVSQLWRYVCLCHTYAGMSYFCSYVMLMQVRHTYQGNIVVRMYLCLWRYLIWISYLVGRYFVKVTEKRSPDDLGMKSGMHLGRSGERATQSSCYCRLLLPRPLLRLDWHQKLYPKLELGEEKENHRKSHISYLMTQDLQRPNVPSIASHK